MARLAVGRVALVHDGGGAAHRRRGVYRAFGSDGAVVHRGNIAGGGQRAAPLPGPYGKTFALGRTSCRSASSASATRGCPWLSISSKPAFRSPATTLRGPPCT